MTTDREKGEKGFRAEHGIGLSRSKVDLTRIPSCQTANATDELVRSQDTSSTFIWEQSAS